MKKADKQRPDDEAQSKRFIEAAKKAQTDESHSRADREFRKIVSKTTKKKKG